MLSSQQIEDAKGRTFHTLPNVPYGNHDSVRIAYEWLDAQTKTKRPVRLARPLKHIIEAWGGAYVSWTDVEVAAQMLGLRGRYPYFNISARLTEPHPRRMKDIATAIADSGYPAHYGERYVSKEA